MLRKLLAGKIILLVKTERGTKKQHVFYKSVKYYSINIKFWIT